MLNLNNFHILLLFVTLNYPRGPRSLNSITVNFSSYNYTLKFTEIYFIGIGILKRFAILQQPILSCLYSESVQRKALYLCKTLSNHSRLNLCK